MNANNRQIPESQVAKDFVEKIHDLKIVLIRDLIAMDAKWTLFVAAALSYRYDSQLKPFPPHYVNERGLNIEALVSVINEIPTLKIILNNIIEEDYDQLDTEIIDLLHWVLIYGNDPSLRTLTNEEFNYVLKKIPHKNAKTMPTQVFEVLHSSNSKAEHKFRKQIKNFKTKYAFHGSKFDSFFSILKHGLQQHLCKNGYFGDGIYLSSELSVSMNYSPSGAAWGSSLCGSVISCIAVCEYIEDLEYVKFYEKADKLKNELPKSYLVINNNEIVRLRYLLFYGKHNYKNSHTNIALNWMYKNKLILSICCYTLFLAAIGIANSGNGTYLVKYLIKKSCEMLNILKRFITQHS